MSRGRLLDRRYSLGGIGDVAPPVQPDNEKSSHGGNRSIILVGLMGVGKTTVGQLLADRLRRPFVDTDHEIEHVTRMSISDLFDRYGETAFRDGERRVIERLIDGIPKVIATGGGAFMNEQTRSLILERGRAIWLDADLDVLVARTGRRPGQRPLLRGRDPRRTLAELAVVRSPIYALAHFHVRNQTGCHRMAVKAILEAIGER